MPSGTSNYGGGVLAPGYIMTQNPLTGTNEPMKETQQNIDKYNRTVNEINRNRQTIATLYPTSTTAFPALANITNKNQLLDQKISQQDQLRLSTIPIQLPINQPKEKGYAPNKLTAIKQTPLYTTEELAARKQELSKAGFQENQIDFLTSSAGGSYTFYEGKKVPQSQKSKEYFETAHQEALAKEKRFSETVAAGGIVALGLIPAAVSAPGLLVGAGLAVAGSQGSTIGQTIGNPFTNQKPTIGTATAEKATKLGLIASEKEANKDLTSNLIYNFVPGGQVASKDTFIKAAQDYLINEKGLAPAQAYREANALYDQYIVGGAAGEVAGMITLSGGTEILGRTFVKKALKDTTIKTGVSFFGKESQAIATKTGFAIGKAGAVEGLGFYELERKAKMKNFDIGEAAFYTGAGALSAGVIGGALVAGSFTNPKLANVVQKGLYIIDPTEKPGDVTANKVSILLGRDFNPKVKVTTIIPTQTASNSLTQTKQNTSTILNTKQNQVINVPTMAETNTNLFNQTNTATNTKTNTPVSPNLLTNIQLNTNENTNTEQNTILPTQTNTNTTTTTNTPTNVNTTTFTGLPIFPLGSFGIGDASGGRSKKFGVKNTTKFKSLFGIPAKTSFTNTKKTSFIKQPTKPTNQLIKMKNYFSSTTNKPIFNLTKTSGFSGTKNFMPKQKQSLFKLGSSKYSVKINKPLIVIPKQTSFFRSMNKNNAIKKVRLF